VLQQRAIFYFGGLALALACLLSWPALAHSEQDSPAKETVNSIGMKLVYIRMGNSRWAHPVRTRTHLAEEPQHRVRITKPFYMGKYEVTRGEFRKFVDETTTRLTRKGQKRR